MCVVHVLDSLYTAAAAANRDVIINRTCSSLAPLAVRHLRAQCKHKKKAPPIRLDCDNSAPGNETHEMLFGAPLPGNWKATDKRKGISLFRRSTLNYTLDDQE